MIEYRVGNELIIDDVIALYRASSLGERRPFADRARMQAMLSNSNLVVSAWDGTVIVGISRALSDFSYVTYLSDLVVRDSHQRQGIGKELIRQTQKAAGAQASLVLLSAPLAVDYYPHIGFERHPSAWTLSPGQVLPPT